MAEGEAPWRNGKGCVIVRVRATPKSSKNEIGGVRETAEGPAFEARVRAAPEDGEANAALERLLAEWLDMPRGAVRLVSGGKGRVKSFAVGGDPEEIERRLAERLAANQE